jgi:hypothetical protein
MHTEVTMHVVLPLLALVVVQPRLALPINKGPRPMTAVASLGKPSFLNLRMQTYKLVPKSVKVVQDGKEVAYDAHRLTEVTRQVALKDVQVYRTDGTRVGAGDLPHLLRGEVLALCSTTGERVDPIYLRLIKEGTLIFVVPQDLLFPPDEAPAMPPVPRQYN